MQFALYNSIKHTSEPGLKGNCLHCHKEVIAKCGAKNVWHWAHVKSDACDTWTEPETPWHREWKTKFGTEYSEIRIQKSGFYHIADVLNKNGIVFEFQNSPISSEIIKARELFYGEKMIWILNGISFKDNFRIYDEEFIKHWKFSVLDEFANTNYPQIKNSLIVEDWQIKSDLIKSFVLEKGFEYRENFGIYTYHLNENRNSQQLVLKINEDLVNFYEIHKSKKTSTKVEFVWERFRRSWQEAERSVFIDFDEEYLLYITNGIGKKYGQGNKILKAKFIEKYC